MWTSTVSADYKRRAKKYEKRHRLAFQAALNNLDTYFRLLQTGKAVRELDLGFVHPEPGGVLAIDQKGSPHATEIRLYVYPDQTEHVLQCVDAWG